MNHGKLFLGLLLCVTVSAGSAWAHDRGYGRGGARVGVYVGVPFAYSWHVVPQPYYAPYYYNYPPYYYPRQVIVQPEPQVYIERAVPQSAPQAQAYWYYCNAPQGYYPYVKECPAGWQQVVPTLPPRN